MFLDIPEAMRARMNELRERSRSQPRETTPRDVRLAQISPEVGKFLAILLANAPAGEVVEIGTSGGYSTLWLALACRATGRKVTTYEIRPKKIEVARETFRLAGVEDVVGSVLGDARDYLPRHEQVAFCFLDADKEVYADCYELIVPRLVPGGLLVADNAINHQAELQPMLDRALSDARVDALIVPLGQGELFCRKV